MNFYDYSKKIWNAGKALRTFITNLLFMKHFLGAEHCVVAYVYVLSHPYNPGKEDVSVPTS